MGVRGKLRWATSACLHALDQQLHVPPAACREAAEFLLDAKLICPLGRKVRVAQTTNGEPPHWTSTAMEQAGAGRIPERSMLRRATSRRRLSWFRGLDLDATMTEKTVSAHAEIIMQMPAKK